MGIANNVGYIVLVLVIFGFIIIICVINKYYHIQICERWGTEWFLNVKLTRRRQQGCPLRLNNTNFTCRPTNQNRARTDFRYPNSTTSSNGGISGNSLSNNRINVNLISQTTCNINIHVSRDDGSTADSFLTQQQRGNSRESQQGSGDPGGGGHISRIFSTMASSSYPVIRTDRPFGVTRLQQPNTANGGGSSPTRLSSRNLPIFGIPPPSFESVTSSRGTDPALFRQSSISSHSHSPPPSFENSFMFDTLPSVEDGGARGPPPIPVGFLDALAVLPDYDSLHHGPPPTYDSIFPS